MTEHNQETTTKDAEKPEYSGLWAYIDNKKRKIGYAYKTQNGNLCIRGDDLLDKTQLGKLLAQGVYVIQNES
tara:strand:- start:203 stop:418 length:216 start_codon:yes stop_codon:yes gene_type:complete